MPKALSPQVELDPSAILASGGGSNYDPEAAAIEKELKSLELEERREKKALKDEKFQQELAVRKQTAVNMQKKREDMERTQTYCGHMKPNMTPAIAGQRDHNNKYHLICAFCAKEFDPDVSPLPPHLRINPDLVGGPVL